MSSEIISLGEWGGNGGKRWSCMATNGITDINIRADTNIKSLSFGDASGVFSGIFGGGYPNDLGNDNVISIKWPAEYLTSISGTYGNYSGLQVILSLSFKTNLTTHGPFGRSDLGQAFSIPIDDNVVAGFYGRCGYYLDAIGILVQPLNPGGSVSVGQWGGPGGDPFTFKVDPSYIKQITVSHGANIQFISFKDANDRDYGPFGGNHEPNPQDVIDIGSSERLTCISGTIGNYKEFTVVTSLSFLLSNNTTKGPYGSENGTPFSIPIQGSEVIGFFGKSGWYLDSIGIYVKQVALRIP